MESPSNDENPTENNCVVGDVTEHNTLPYDVMERAFGKLQRQAREALLAEAEMQKKLARALQAAQKHQHRTEGLEVFVSALREEVRQEQIRSGAASERYFATARTLIEESDELKKKVSELQYQDKGRERFSDRHSSALLGQLDEIERLKNLLKQHNIDCRDPCTTNNNLTQTNPIPDAKLFLHTRPNQTQEKEIRQEIGQLKSNLRVQHVQHKIETERVKAENRRLLHHIKQLVITLVRSMVASKPTVSDVTQTVAVLSTMLEFSPSERMGAGIPFCKNVSRTLLQKNMLNATEAQQEKKKQEKKKEGEVKKTEPRIYLNLLNEKKKDEEEKAGAVGVVRRVSFSELFAEFVNADVNACGGDGIGERICSMGQRI